MFDASFDVFANNYDNIRPGYPKQMYKDIIEVCFLGKSSALLEIGVGSGIATVEIAKSGAKVIGIEPGTNLAKIARRRTEDFPNVEIVETMFEDFSYSKKFDCIIALTSFHWISDQDKYKKSYEMLSDDGNFVVVWNTFLQSGELVTEEVNSLYSKILPDVYPESDDNVNKKTLEKLNGRELEIVGNDLFHIHFLRKYITVYNYNKETYPMLLNTFPKIIKVDKDRKNMFLEKVGFTVEKYGKISVPVLTTVLVVRKRNTI